MPAESVFMLMRRQAADFREETDALFALLEPLRDDEWTQRTQFKGWTIDDVVAHVHLGNHAAALSLNDPEAFARFMRDFRSASARGDGHLVATHAWLRGTRGGALLRLWRGFAIEMAEHFARSDPKRRVPWVGPDMSARSSITARLMETWAHGQAVHDLLGATRRDTDRIRNVAVLGVNTFAWTFTNRGLPVPETIPAVRLTAPSGETWTWGAAEADDLVAGSAVEFCQVVTQVRNVADTSLRVVGETAGRWMSIAQCFAGPPEDPPPPGSRFLRVGAATR